MSFCLYSVRVLANGVTSDTISWDCGLDCPPGGVFVSDEIHQPDYTEHEPENE